MDDGTVKAWGANAYGQLGEGEQGFEVQTNINQHVAHTVRWSVQGKSEELTGIAAVAAGGGSDFALTEGGEVWAWGNDTTGHSASTSKPANRKNATRKRPMTASSKRVASSRAR